MKKSTKFSPEVRERAAPLVQEHRSEHPLPEDHSLFRTLMLDCRFGIQPSLLRHLPF